MTPRSVINARGEPVSCLNDRLQRVSELDQEGERGLWSRSGCVTLLAVCVSAASVLNGQRPPRATYEWCPGRARCAMPSRPLPTAQPVYEGSEIMSATANGIWSRCLMRNTQWRALTSWLATGNDVVQGLALEGAAGQWLDLKGTVWTRGACLVVGDYLFVVTALAVASWPLKRLLRTATNSRTAQAVTTNGLTFC